MPRKLCPLLYNQHSAYWGNKWENKWVNETTTQRLVWCRQILAGRGVRKFRSRPFSAGTSNLVLNSPNPSFLPTQFIEILGKIFYDFFNPYKLWHKIAQMVAQMVEASACNAGDPGMIPESGRAPGEGNGAPLQYSCLGNSMDGGAWWAI